MQPGWYRAKSEETHEWVEGYYTKIKHWLTGEYIHLIFSDDAEMYPRNEFIGWTAVIPETVCRLVRGADYDLCPEAHEIFQGDIVAFWDRHVDMDRDEPIDTAVVVNEHCVSETKKGLGRWFPQDTISVRVIGNAYDNPELMEGYCLSHFITGLRDYPGDMDSYTKDHRYLTETYGIHGAHAACYLYNFENDYICHIFNDGCKQIEVCRRIREEEEK